MKNYAVIVAGGGGKRFDPSYPKQFHPLLGKPMLAYSIRAFFEAIPEITIIVVLPEKHIDYWHHLCLKYTFEIPHTTICGGPERFHSVQRGISLVEQNSLVAIHDGARPLVTIAAIQTAFHIAKTHQAVVTAVFPNDSVRMVNGALNKPLSRENIRLIQTPQVFQSDILQKAYRQNYLSSFTDDATVVEALGIPITLIEGDHENMKVTRPIDLKLVEAILKTRINFL